MIGKITQMNLCLAVFRSRTQTYEFIEYMARSGISCRAVNTPPEAHIGCGISAEFYIAHKPYAYEVISRRGLNSFVAFYKVVKSGKRTETIKQ